MFVNNCIYPLCENVTKGQENEGFEIFQVMCCVCCSLWGWNVFPLITFFFTPGKANFLTNQNPHSLYQLSSLWNVCTHVCVHAHSTFRDQASDGQRAHFPNVNISVKTWRVGVNRILLNRERLRAPLSPRWRRARGGNQPLPPRFLKHCPFIKEKPPTAFLNHRTLYRCLIVPLKPRHAVFFRSVIEDV